MDGRSNARFIRDGVQNRWGKWALEPMDIEVYPLFVADPRDGKRFMLMLDYNDDKDFHDLPGGPSAATVRVTDLVTDQEHVVRRGPCGLGCYCGAEFAVEA